MYWVCIFGTNTVNPASKRCSWTFNFGIKRHAAETFRSATHIGASKVHASASLTFLHMYMYLPVPCFSIQLAGMELVQLPSVLHW